MTEPVVKNILLKISSIAGLLVLVCVCNCMARQLDPADSLIQQKMSAYTDAHPHGILFVHTDKTVYTNNETIWFSAYLVKSEGVAPEMHQFVCAVLVHEHSRKIYRQQKYIMENGVAFGSLLLPDTIPPGDYRLMVYTNLLDNNNKPVASFVQPVTIKSITQRSFHASLQLTDSIPDANGMLCARLTWIPKTSVNLSGKVRATVQYSVGGFQSKQANVESNSYEILIQKQQLQPNATLLSSVRYNNELQYVSLPLPSTEKDSLKIRFFPEGGFMVDEVESVIGWEAHSSNQLPVAVKALLYKNDKPIDTIETSGSGMGKFLLKPNRSDVYTIKPLVSSGIAAAKEYRLPEILERGIVLQVKDAVVNDSLRISLFSKEVRSLRVIVHNYNTVFLSFEISSKPSGTKVLAALPEIPKGISMITVLDENGKAVAERLFFANYRQKQKEELSTDKSVYGKREKATATFRLSDTLGNPVQGLVSVAVVQTNRIEYRKQQDIAVYSYLGAALGELQKPLAGRILDDKDLLNDILLIKGWRRFSWQSVQNITEHPGEKNIQMPVITANVLLNDKPLKKPVAVTFINDGKVEIDHTDSNGLLTLNPSQLVVEENRKVHLFISEKNKTGYSIKVDDPFLQIDRQIVQQAWAPLPVGKRITETSTREQEVEGMENAKLLQEVVVTASTGGGLYGAKANACGDYVCMNDVLNCPRHFADKNNRLPEKGKRYKNGVVIKRMLSENKTMDVIARETGQQMEALRYVVYDGCTVSESQAGIEGIFLAREFYGVNMEPDAADGPQFLSTLFWQPAGLLDAKGEKHFSFYTGDISGSFRIIVQGVGTGDLIVKETQFVVK